MALQGTLDTFELPDVLRLLASTGKTGWLRVDSDRGTGEVVLVEGHVVGIDPPAPAGDPAEALFELLRAREGSFGFEPAEPGDLAGAAGGERHDVETLLRQAEDLLAAWREVAAVVPSTAMWVALVPELGAPEVVVDAERWRVLAAVGGGLTVAELGGALGLGELPVCRAVRDLVELGVAVVTDPPAGAAPGAEPALDTAASAVEPDVAEPEVAEAGPVAQPAVDGWEEVRAPVHGEPVPAAGEPAGLGPSEPVEPAGFEPSGPSEPAEPAWSSWQDGEAPSPVADVSPDAVEAPTADEPVEAVEPDPWARAGSAVGAAPAGAEAPGGLLAGEEARQLSALSPRAAQAVAAAAATEADAVPAPEPAEDGEEPLNRSLLLKFLGSVKS